MQKNFLANFIRFQNELPIESVFVSIRYYQFQGGIVKRTYVMLAMFMVIATVTAQPWSYDFGTGTGSHSSGISTTFLPTPPAGSARVRVGTGGGSFNLENPGLVSLGSNTEQRIVAPTSSSVNKFSVYDYTGGKTSYLAFSVLLGNSTGGNADTGTFYLFVGDGLSYYDNSGFSGTQVFTGIRWNFSTGGVVTTSYRNGGSWTNITPAPFSQGSVYTVEVYGNNTTSSATYNIGKASYSLAANKQDIWVNGSLVGDDLSKAQLANDSNIDSFMFYGENSTSNAANCFLDNITYSNTLPISAVTEPTAQPTNLQFSNILPTSFDVSFLAASPAADGYLALRKAGSAPSVDPTDGTSYSVGSSIGDGVVAHSGSGTTFSESSLSSSTTYYYKIYSYNGSGSSTDYLLTNPLTGNQTTASGAVLATLTTTVVSAITVNSASSGGNVTDDGGASVTARGVCWNTTGSPTLDDCDNYTTDGSGTGIFTSSLAGLSEYQLYYVRAYATNSAGTGYGSEVTFTTLKNEPSNYPSTFTVGTTSVSSIQLTWTDASKTTPDGYLIKGSVSGFGDITPPDDGAPESNSTLIRNVVQGNQTYTFSNLDPGTPYYFKIYPYTNSGSNIDYKIDGAVPQATATTLEEPDVLYYWSFNDDVPSSGNWSQPIDSQIGSGALTYTFANAVSFGGTTANALSGYIAGGSFVPQGGTANENNGEEFVLSIPTTGYKDIYLAYATQRTSTGFTSQAIYYTLDGTGYTLKETITSIPSSWGIQTIDFSSISGVDNNSNFAVRIILDGASSDTGNNRFDNIRISGYVYYDYPEGVEVTVGENTVTITGGNANNSTGVFDPPPNPSFTIEDEFIFDLLGDGPWTVTFGTQAQWAAYNLDGTWYSEEAVDEAIEIVIDQIVPPVRGRIVAIFLGNGEDPTLPVELSSFTATISAQNYVNLMWTTQSETGVLGYYVYRATSPEVGQAQMISPLIPATNTSHQQNYVFTDTELYQSGNYYYWLQNMDFDGISTFHGPVSVYYDAGGSDPTPGIPEVTELQAIYPNPFNPLAYIPFSLADRNEVNFTIYNSRGQIVRNISAGTKEAGSYRIEWDGRDNAGSNCTTGVYHIRMQAGRDSFIRKAVLLK
jgi:hypothetical protein